MEFTTDVLLLLFAIYFLAILVSYYFGFSKGEKSLRARSDLIRPSLKDVTIRGKYQIEKTSIKEISEKIQNYFLSYPSLIFAVGRTGENCLLIRRVISMEKGKKYFKRLLEMRDGIPAEMYLFFSKEDDSILIDAVSRPVMYYKITQQVKLDYEFSSIEEAQEECKIFMNQILKGVLGAEIKEQPQPESHMKAFEEIELLYNTPSENKINKKVHELILDAKRRILIAGWIDREFLGDLEKIKSKRKNIEIRVITKDPSGAADKTVKLDFKRLINTIEPKNVRINSRFHDRFVISDHKCIIGSMYFTSASKIRYESTVYTNIRNIIDELEVHFERIWNDIESKHPRV